jgi:hypothetical protein
MRDRRSAAVLLSASVLAALASPVAGQSPSPAPASAPPSASAVPGPVLGVTPSAYTWSPIAAPAGAELTRIDGTAVLPDGTWVALASPPDIADDELVWVLPPGAAAVELAKISKSSSSHPEALARLGDGLVAVGSGKAFASADGRTWSPVKAKLKGVAPGRAAALGAGSVVIANIPGKKPLGVVRTDDGKAWTKTPLVAPGGEQLYPEFIATSRDGAVVVSATGDGPHVWTSLDGTTYTETALAFDPAPYNSVRGLVYGPAGPVLVAGLEDGSRFVIDHAADGTTWTQAYESAGRSIQGRSLVRLADASGGGLLAIGDGMLLTSPDGLAWTATEVPEMAGIRVDAATALPDGRVVLVVRSDESVTSLLVGSPLSEA